ncbi:30S ribosomal protein S16 [Candidatus Adlerbacteria bacterium RIFCSPLOWO2_01_FULL_51_16]|uniref:Small ribosomal subunit protein bS16 n=1 Tax=Candidatus Adlerbacteria bacterium RIFCSPLOWO2_01_FULL_51_16 TaxID=1797243 RepID=A0A1F4XFG2_9BACT|nr:MAG: 30S ribosomal protein S16 [Candidatus Adlerbacteria bacterium RIFCSPLOWO2_01_FULL_51_16]
MLTIRLQRRGRTNDPSFRVIVVDSKRSTKTGNYVELVGSYDARTDRVELKAERIKHWMKEGAQVSDTVHNLLISQKIIEGKKRNVLPRKSPPKKEEVTAAPAEIAVAAEGNSEKEETPAPEASVPEATKEDKSVAEETPAQ